MHLQILESGHRLRARAVLWAAEHLGGTPIDDVGTTSLYRPELFGRNFLKLAGGVLCGPSEWSRGERELFAAFISRTNRCRYCTAIHSEMAFLGLDKKITTESLDDWRTSDFSPRIKAVFALLEAVASRPEDTAKAEVDAARSEGISDESITEVLYLAFVFNLINRVADALGFSWASESELEKSARILNRIEYRLPSILLR